MAPLEKNERPGAALGVGLVGLGHVVVLGSGLVLHMLAARQLQPSGYARFAGLLALELWMLLALTGGVPQAVRRLVSADAANLPTAKWWLFHVHLPFTLLIAALLAAVGWLAADTLFAAELSLPLVLLAADILVRAGLLDPTWNLLNGAGRHFAQSTFISAFSLLRLGCVASLVSIRGELVDAVAGLLLSAAIASVAALVTLRRFVPAAAAQAGSRPMRVLPVAGWSLAYEALAYLLLPLNLWIGLGIIADQEDAGRFAACHALARVPVLLGFVFASGLFHRLMAAFAAGDIVRGKAVAAGGFRALLLLLAPACALSFIIGDEFLTRVFGARFANSGALLGTIITGAGAIAAFLFLGEVLAAAGRLGTRTICVVPLTIVSAVCAALLIVPLGGIGGSIALCITGALGTLLTAFLVARSVGSIVPWPSIARSLAATAALLLVGSEAWPGAATAWEWKVLCGMLTYAATLTLLGEFRSSRWIGLPRLMSSKDGPSPMERSHESSRAANACLGKSAP